MTTDHNDNRKGITPPPPFYLWGGEGQDLADRKQAKNYISLETVPLYLLARN
jgi:hypothetical protein